MPTMVLLATFEVNWGQSKSLSVNNIRLVLPLYFSKDDDRSGQHEQAEIAPIHFFIPHQELSKPVKPGVANLNNPTPCLKVRVLVFFFNLFATRPDMRNIAPFFNLALGRFAHITGIKAEVLLGQVLTGAADDHAIQSGRE